MLEFPCSSTMLWTIAFFAVAALGDHHSRDFHFENDKVVLYSEPYNPQEKSFSSSSISCPYSEGKLVLALLLKDKNWEAILPRKRDRAISKMAKFFSITKDEFTLDDVTKHDLHEMNKKSLHHGKNQINLSKKVGRVEFVIGCGKQYSTAGKLIANQIGHQMKENSIDDISGLDFGWWVIYSKHANNKTPRLRRQADGSGEEDEDYYEYDDEEPLTETPVTSTTHARRHHHGLSNKQNGGGSSSSSVTTPMSILVPVVVIGPEQQVKQVTTTPAPAPYENEIVEKEVSELQEQILRTIENNEKVEAIEAGLEPGETLKKDDFDEVFDKSPIEPIVKSILENGDREGDYIVEDIPSIHFTNVPRATTASSDEVKVPETTPPITTTSTTKVSVAEPENPTSTYNTIKTSPSAVYTSPGTTTTTTEQKQTETGSTTEFDDDKENDDEDYVVSTRVDTDFESYKIPENTGSATTTTTTMVNINEDENNNSQFSAASTPLTTTATTNEIIINNNSNNLNELSTIPTAATTPLITDSDLLLLVSSSTTIPVLSSSSSIASNNDYDETLVSSEAAAGTTSSISPHESVTIFTFTTTTTQATTTTSDNADNVESQTNVEYNQNETTPRTVASPAPEEDNYDDEYDDYDVEISSSVRPKSSTTSTTSTTEVSEEDVAVNNPPTVANRLPKSPVTAGKPFVIYVPPENFVDIEDGHKLVLELLDHNENPLKATSWIQFNPERREIYGLPLDDATSKHQYILRATDSGNESVIEMIDIHVQQHKGHRSVNHEIEFNVRLNEKFERIIDWELKLIEAIAKVLSTDTADIVVREVRHHPGDVNAWTFIYTNETLPKDHCPEEELEELVERIYIDDLNKALENSMIVKSVHEQLVGNCKKHLPKSKVTLAPSNNFPPVPRNPVDRVNATVGQLLVYRVPADTFYDPEDETDLKLSLLSLDRTKLDPHHWLQFDPKNREFYGIPKTSDLGQKEYILVAEDREGLTANDALVVVVNPAYKRDYSALFDFILGIPYDTFNSSDKQRRFVENVAQVFGDSDTSHIMVRNIRRQPQTHNVGINWYNTTLHRTHHRCPTQEIELLRETLMHSDSSLRDRVRETLGSEFNLVSVNIHPVGACQGADTVHHEIPIKTDDPMPRENDDYLLTFVLPAVIILAMLLLASIVACVLHRRRLTGKMELGDEEERKSFRNKGIPVIFQDELDEKPDIASKSPIILKEEKPALLPPTYTGINPEGDNEDLDEYLPPPGVGPVNSRESRGKSPVTPSYRRPPPYVSP